MPVDRAEIAQIEEAQRTEETQAIVPREPTKSLMDFRATVQGAASPELRRDRLRSLSARGSDRHLAICQDLMALADAVDELLRRELERDMKAAIVVVEAPPVDPKEAATPGVMIGGPSA